MSETPEAELIALTTDIVAAYVGRNVVPAAQLPALIASVHAALEATKTGPVVADTIETKKLTAAQIRKSITPDRIISFEDGKGYTSLRRHLGTHGLTPDAYRAKWGLPKDYPMVAPAYSARRSELAKASGLGQARKGKGGK